jgi:hypothetical protein
MEAMRMIQFCELTGMKPYKLTRRLEEFDVIYKDGWSKPWVVINEKNLRLAKIYSTIRMYRGKLPRMTKEEFSNRYQVPIEKIDRWWKSLTKENIGGIDMVADTATNRKFLRVAK